MDETKQLQEWKNLKSKEGYSSLDINYYLHYLKTHGYIESFTWTKIKKWTPSLSSQNEGIQVLLGSATSNNLRPTAQHCYDTGTENLVTNIDTMYNKFCNSYRGPMSTHGIAIRHSNTDGTQIFDTAKVYSILFSLDTLLWSIVNVFAAYTFKLE